MWKCPNCNTNNEGEFCRVCGGKAKKKSIVPVVAGVMLVFMLILTGGAYLFVSQDEVFLNNDAQTQSAEDKTETKSSDKKDKKTVKRAQKVNQKHKKGRADAPKSRKVIEDVEDKVLDIRSWYNDTQNNLASLTTSQDASGRVKYYDENSELVRMDFPSESTDRYTRYYYFKDDELYFAFIFDGEEEHRLYFYEETLFRWIDDSGVIHDNETDNKEFILKETKALKEVK